MSDQIAWIASIPVLSMHIQQAAAAATTAATAAAAILTTAAFSFFSFWYRIATTS